MDDTPGSEVIKVEYSLNLKIKLNDWLHEDICPQAANHYALFWVWEWRFITSGPGVWPFWAQKSEKDVPDMTMPNI